MNVRVLIADDQALFREAITTLLARDPRLEVTASVDSGDAAIEFVRAHAVDVVLMDIRMPGTDGIAATREVLRLRPQVRVLVLTTFDLDEYVYAAVREGASGFLTKDATPAALADAIVAVAAGEAVMSSSATRALLGFVREGRRRLRPTLSPFSAPASRRSHGCWRPEHPTTTSPADSFSPRTP